MNFSKKLSLKDAPFYALVLLTFFPLMPFGVISTVTIIFSLLTVIIYHKNIKLNFTTRKKRILINVSFFFLLSLTIFYSENKASALVAIQRDINLVLFPLIILLYFPVLSKKKVAIIINSFIIATSIVLLIYVLAITKYGINNHHLKTFFNYPFRNIIEGKTYIDITPTYLSVWMSFSIVCLIEKIKKNKNLSNKIAFYLLSILFYLFIFISSARMVFVIINIAIFFNILMVKNFKKKILIILSIITLGFITLYYISDGKSFKYRYFDEIFVKKIIEPRGRTPSSLSIRYGIYKCATNLVVKSPITGFGLGDVQKKLNDCYKESYRTSVFRRTKLDSHNYYFYLILSGGVLVLILFLLMIVFNFRIAISHNNILYISLLIIVCFICLTENFLARVHGTIFFGMFNAVFLLKKCSNKIKE